MFLELIGSVIGFVIKYTVFFFLIYGAVRLALNH